MKRPALLLAFFALLASAARAEGVETSTAPARTVEDIYGGAAFPDPFSRGGGGAGGSTTLAVEDFDLEELSIHNLELKGIMTDRKGSSFALFIDPHSKTGLILRNSRLFDYKKRQIPGIKGSINLIQKKVQLITEEKDVQVFYLGEEDADGEEFKDEDAPGEE